MGWTRDARRRSVAGVAISAMMLAGCTAAPPPWPGSKQAHKPTGLPGPDLTQTAMLPGENSGRVIFPNNRLFGYVGYPGAPGQGRLGIGDLDDRVEEIKEKSSEYSDGRNVIPVMELITVTVMPSPGPDGKWRSRTDPEIIDDYVAAAKRHGAILLLDIQPGQASFLDEVKALEKYLVEPNVGVALDPEWAMKPGQVPMQDFGSTSGEDLNAVADYLQSLVWQHDLPEKVMLYHILHPSIISNESALKPHSGVVLIKNVDGIGGPKAKTGTYQRALEGRPEYVHMGFKLFYEEDVQSSGVLMTPPQVLALEPQPEIVIYE